MTEPHSDSPRYDSTRKAWETIWDGASMNVELQAVRYPRSMATIHEYRPYLPQNEFILEAGSGLSAVVITLREMGYTVTGLDYAENALHASRQHDPTLALAVGDVHALPYAPDSVGAYLSFGVLEHFEHGLGPALAEAYRVVKPGGVLVLTIPYPNIAQRLIAWRRRGQGSTLNDEDFYESTYTRDKLCQAVTDAGFALEKVIPTSHAFTLWGLGGLFRGAGYYQTSRLADVLGGILRIILPWPFNFSTLVIGRKKTPG
jgi:SAM-dependent methyltransferase